MKKVLFVANIAKHIIRFHLPYLKWFKENGYETHVAACGIENIPFCDVQHNIPIVRSPFSFNNIDAHKQLKEIIDANEFELVHGHTPMGGVLARTASIKARRKGTKVLYTAHGFHFYKGSSVKNWLMYFTTEKIISFFTDAIITINKEDFDVLHKYKFNCKFKYLIPGIGIDIQKLNCSINFDKNDFRIKNNLNEKDFVLIYLAEFIERKNHKFIIYATHELKVLIPDLKILFAGRGVLQESIEKLINQENLNETIKVLGFRTDIGDLISLSDVGISSSKQEGLGLNLAEEMFCGLPVVASEDRGHKEMVIHGFNGFMFKQNNTKEFVKYILYLYNNTEKRIEMGVSACNSVQKFNLENSIAAMSKIYKSILSENV